MGFIPPNDLRRPFTTIVHMTRKLDVFFKDFKKFFSRRLSDAIRALAI